MSTKKIEVKIPKIFDLTDIESKILPEDLERLKAKDFEELGHSWKVYHGRIKSEQHLRSKDGIARYEYNLNMYNWIDKSRENAKTATILSEMEHETS